MTREEAARIFDPKTTLAAYAERSYYVGFKGQEKWKKDVDEACEMGAKALRELDLQEKQELLVGDEQISVEDRLPVHKEPESGKFA